MDLLMDSSPKSLGRTNPTHDMEDAASDPFITFTGCMIVGGVVILIILSIGWVVWRSVRKVPSVCQRTTSAVCALTQAVLKKMLASSVEKQRSGLSEEEKKKKKEGEEGNGEGALIPRSDNDSEGMRGDEGMSFMEVPNHCIVSMPKTEV